MENFTKTYNFYGCYCKIDKKSGDLFIKWANESWFKKFEKNEMDEILKEWKNINRIYKPLPVLLYTDWKNWKIESYNEFAI